MHIQNMALLSAAAAMQRIQNNVLFKIFHPFHSKVKHFHVGNAVNHSVLNKVNSSALNFDNFKDAFGTKRTSELVRALFIIHLCSKSWVTDNSLTWLRVGERVLGTRLFTAVMKRTFYGQFIGGETPSEMQKTVASCRNSGAGSILLVPVEEDPPAHIRDKIYDDSTQNIINCINMTASFVGSRPMMQMKIPAIMSTELCTELSRLFPEPSKQPEIIERLARCIKEDNTVEIPGLSEDFQSQLNKGLKRFATIAKVASTKNVILMIDAEYTYLNPALNLVTLAMMLAYNTNTTVIAYTYQNYLKDIHSTLRRDMEFISRKGVCFGAKMVRGAYIFTERSRAMMLGYPDPIHATIDDTAKSYQHSVGLMLDRIQKDPHKNTVIVATHNELAIENIIRKMQECNIPQDSESVLFAQIFGMGDYITCTLGKNGFLTYKSIPYGSLNETLPYLSRRAQENRAIFEGTRREKELLKAALKDRLKQKMFFKATT